MKKWRPWIGILVSLVCLYLAARGTDLSGMAQALLHLDYGLLAFAFGLAVLGLALRAVRWRVLLQPVSSPGLGRLLRITSIGYFLNAVLPLRAGDVLRSYLLAELEKLSLARVLSTVVVERIADTLAILLLLAAAVPFVVIPAPLVRPVVFVTFVALAGASLLVAAAVNKQRSVSLAESLMRRFAFMNAAWLRTNLQSAVDGLAALGSLSSAAQLALWTLAAWLLGTLQLYVVMLSADLRVPFVAALVVLCITSLGMTVPSSPGYLGVFEYLTVVALGLFGVSKEFALSYALAAHALGYLAQIVSGLVALWLEGYSYARLGGALAKAQGHANTT
jgi:uncharacterized protein (TIRG00374 family)